MLEYSALPAGDRTRCWRSSPSWSQYFSVADITFACVLREMRKNEVLHAYPNVEAVPQTLRRAAGVREVLNAYEDRLGIERGSAK